MSSETITRNDLTNILNEVLPPQKINTETITPSITTSTGTLVSAGIKKFGNVVTLRLIVQNSATVASAGNLYIGTLNDVSYRPTGGNVSGGSYYGVNSLGASLATSGQIVIRNASASSLTVTGTNTATVTLTYIID